MRLSMDANCLLCGVQYVCLLIFTNIINGISYYISTGSSFLTMQNNSQSIWILLNMIIRNYGMWVHQIKTPIAALDILLQNTEQFLYEEDIVNSRINKRLEIIQESIPVSDMKMELFKIEQYVEMALNYLRVEDISSDLSFKQYAVDDMVRQVIRKYAKIFISKKIKMNFKPTGRYIVTDDKWFVFVLEQFISNALKYTKKGQISIYMKEKSLVIEDTGIGIPAEDLPRIFEKGFTGYNGRENKKSTGIGLYLCKNIMDKLQWNITVDSEVGSGTKIYLTKM